MTPKQLSKLETRIATLKQSNRIVWIEGINAQVIKGKIAGKPVFFVKADSLNANGGSWYYITRWAETGYQCTCEYQGYKQCQHIPQVSEYNYQQYQREFRKHVAAMEAERKQQVSTPAAQFEEGQEVVYSYCPGIAFTGIIVGKRTRLNGEDGYKLQTKFWTEVIPVRFLTSKATAKPETDETHRVSRVDGLRTRWYPEYRQGAEWFRYPEPDGNQAVSFVIEGRAEAWLAERLAAVAEQAAEAKMDAFKAGLDERYASDPRHGLSQGEMEAARSNMVHLYDEY